MRNVLIVLAMIVSVVALVMSATPPILADTSASPAEASSTSSVTVIGDINASVPLYPTTSSSPNYTVVSEQPCPNLIMSNSGNKSEGKIIIHFPRALPFGLFPEPFHWRIIKAREVAGTTRFYFCPPYGYEHVTYLDMKDPKAIATIQKYFQVTSLEGFRNKTFATDTDPAHHFAAILATYSDEGQKLESALAKILIDGGDSLPKSMKFTESLHPIWGLDQVFLSRLAREVSSESKGEWTLIAPSFTNRSEFWKNNSKSDTLLIMTRLAGCQRLVIHADGRITWLDPRVMTDEEMKQVHAHNGGPK